MTAWSALLRNHASESGRGQRHDDIGTIVMQIIVEKADYSLGGINWKEQLS
jgi:hypothetical protein